MDVLSLRPECKKRCLSWQHSTAWHSDITVWGGLPIHGDVLGGKGYMFPKDQMTATSKGKPTRSGLYGGGEEGARGLNDWLPEKTLLSASRELLQ